MKCLNSLLLSLLIFMFTGSVAHADRNTLWDIVNGQCVPEYINNNMYQPCSLIDLNNKIAVLKTNNDKYEYLLLSTDKVTGIEDPVLQKDDVPKYFYSAWLAKVFMTEKLGKPIKEKYISLTLNAQNARTQDQLHFHISCLSSEANEVLSKIPDGEEFIGWSLKQIKIPPYSYYYRYVSLNELSNNNRYMFRSIADKVKQENGNLAYTGVGLVNKNPDTFIMLLGIGTSEAGVTAERIQDHECQLAEK